MFDPRTTVLDVLRAGAAAPVETNADLLASDFPEPQAEQPEATPTASQPAQPQPAQVKPQAQEEVEISDEDMTEIMSIVQERRELRATQSFLQDHANDHTPRPENWAKIESYLHTHKLPTNRASIEEAFTVLDGAGQLVRQPYQPYVPPRPAVTPFSTGLTDHGSPAPREMAMTQTDLEAKAELHDQGRRESLDREGNAAARRSGTD